MIRQRQGYNAWGVVTFVGRSHDYPEMSTWLDANLRPEVAADFWKIENMSIADVAATYTDIVTCDFFTRGCDSWDDDVPKTVLYEAGNSSHASSSRSIS